MRDRLAGSGLVGARSELHELASRVDLPPETAINQVVIIEMDGLRVERHLLHDVVDGARNLREISDTRSTHSSTQSFLTMPSCTSAVCESLVAVVSLSGPLAVCEGARCCERIWNTPDGVGFTTAGLAVRKNSGAETIQSTADE
jgi:hypothetical protein